MLKELHLMDRILLSGMIPGQGSWPQLKVWGDCREKIELTSKEIMRYGIASDQQSLRWKQEIDCKVDDDGKDIPGTGTECNLLALTDKPIKNPLSEKELKICKIISGLKKMERSDEGLPTSHMRLYENFVGPAPLDIDFLAAEAEKLEEKEEQAWKDKQAKEDDKE